MKSIILATTFLLGGVFAEAQTETRRSRKGPVPGRDITATDCRTSMAMRRAKMRLAQEGFNAGLGLGKMQSLCETLHSLKDGQETPEPQTLKGLPVGTNTFTNTAMEMDEGIDRFTAEVQRDYVKTCRDRKNLEKLSGKHGISPFVAASVCHQLLKEVLKSIDSQDFTVVQQELLGLKISDILDALGFIEKSSRSIAAGVRLRFARSDKVGYSGDSINPYEVLPNGNRPWYCISRRPYPTNQMTGGKQAGVTTLLFTLLGHDASDSDGFVYSMVNGYEFAGTDSAEHILRSVRVEFACEKESSANCNQFNYDYRILIIEESIRTRNALLAYLLDKFVPGVKSGENHLVKFLKSKSGWALTDYFGRSEKNCYGKKFFKGCEISVNYLQCWEDSSPVFKSTPPILRTRTL
ncbi:MAG: hypothetical protein OXB88_01880 [Bacteriovoracales bacterium]|nr:hypothetical protein [Bacteriovoracales bacterium]